MQDGIPALVIERATVSISAVAPAAANQCNAPPHFGKTSKVSRINIRFGPTDRPLLDRFDELRDDKRLFASDCRERDNFARYGK